MGGPGYTIQDDYPRQHGMHFVKGTVGMARTGMPNSGGCQFFIDVGTPTQLDNQYTIFGKVLKGQEVADAIAGVPRGPGDRPVNPVTINKVTISDTKP
jgi:cyclophilin family peptidyl-prolyl cis-trans isomerase